MVVDALFGKIEENGSLFFLSLPIPGWLKEACREWMENDSIVHLIQIIQEDPNPRKGIHGNKIH